MSQAVAEAMSFQQTVIVAQFVVIVFLVAVTVSLCVAPERLERVIAVVRKMTRTA